MHHSAVTHHCLQLFDTVKDRQHHLITSTSCFLRARAHLPSAWRCVVVSHPTTAMCAQWASPEGSGRGPGEVGGFIHTLVEFSRLCVLLQPFSELLVLLPGGAEVYT